MDRELRYLPDPNVVINVDRVTHLVVDGDTVEIHFGGESCVNVLMPLADVVQALWSCTLSSIRRCR